LKINNVAVRALYYSPGPSLALFRPSIVVLEKFWLSFVIQTPSKVVDLSHTKQIILCVYKKYSNTNTNENLQQYIVPISSDMPTLIRPPPSCSWTQMLQHVLLVGVRVSKRAALRGIDDRFISVIALQDIYEFMK
jgi:hypothetical protein